MLFFFMQAVNEELIFEDPSLYSIKHGHEIANQLEVRGTF